MGNRVMTQPDRLVKLIRAENLPVISAMILVAALVWSYWPALCSMAERWGHDSRYSHGYLVPLFSIWLLWSRRAKAPVMRANRWGVLLVAVASLAKLFGTFFYLEWVDHFSLLLSLASFSYLIGGWACLRWTWPSIAFLIFMIPLPYRAEFLLGTPLQNFATVASTYTLQTLGLPAVAEGNVILIDDSRIGVVEACNGMGMLFMFFAFTTAVILVKQNRMSDRVIIFLSAIPIALFANIVRITLTGFLHVTVGGKIADAFYHDMAGWLMMPLALALLWAELFILTRIFIEPPTAPSTVIDLTFGASLPRSTS